MFSPPTLCIVIPAFNVKNYIIEAIESVLNQTTRPDEVIVIDDGSTDGTSDLLAKYDDLPNWKVIRTLNNGLGPARNLGRALVKSDYLHFFDSDDLLAENFVSRIKQIITEKHRPDMILFAGQTFYDDGFEHFFSPAYSRTVTGDFAQNNGLITKLAAVRETPAQSCLYVTKVELWSKNHLLYPPILHEDEAVLFPLLALSEKTVVLSEIFFHRRVRPGSIMTSGVDARNVNGILRIVHETMEFMAREPALVKPDISAWRARITQFGGRYISLCRKSGVPISWAAVIASLITARSVKYPLRIAYSFLPEVVQGSLRRFKHAIGGV